MWFVKSLEEGWQDCGHIYPQDHDVYHRKAYHEYDEANGYGESCIYHYVDHRGALWHQFMLRPIRQIGDRNIPGGLYDIESVKGLAGPLATNTDSTFLKDAWYPYETWCRENAVVCEYVRFNPFLNNEAIGRAFFDISHSQRVGVVVDLTMSADEIWNNQYDTRQRNMIRKAENSGVTCHLDNSTEAFDKFFELQMLSWERLGAQFHRMHPKHSIQHLIRSLGEAAQVFVTKLNNEIIGASVFLAGHKVFHYQLSAGDIRHRNLGAQNYLLHKVALWAKERGFEHFHLAAGRTSSPDDALFRFKKSLSPGRVQYPIGTKHYSPDHFRMLCEIWRDQAKGQDLPRHSMPYREPLPIVTN